MEGIDEYTAEAQPTSNIDVHKFHRSLAEMVLSANNPYQEGLPFIGSSDINAMRERQIKSDFAYNSNMKVIWDKKKAALGLNQGFNMFNVIRPTDPVNRWTIDSVLGGPQSADSASH